jgi:hypothetical protein
MQTTITAAAMSIGIDIPIFSWLERPMTAIPAQNFTKYQARA